MIYPFASPGIARQIAFRRLISAALIISAALLLVAGHNNSTATAIIYSHDVAAGTRLKAEDLMEKQVAIDLIPRGQSMKKQDFVGRVLISQRPKSAIALPEDTINTQFDAKNIVGLDGNALIPISLSDPTLAGFVLPGDQISIVALSAETGEPRTVASGAQVVFSSSADHQAAGLKTGSLLLSLDIADAESVAAAAAQSPISVIVTGARAQG
ncbi:hypothetical protein N7326_04460 [Corynebacterium sp. ES2794-CONJ1]|uniref:hypothetical protein n=1 Tax=Corynebacterium sp. ES2794-CONJ1 TaxID=2980553 RepID=UPI0021D92927|nr:hypothetical protein [Corynebacterium sp. ES2794-CONJ1]MCU9519126.1 hypothetical protein [Corynebacterium sp. ES2794-CONJ1]